MKKLFLYLIVFCSVISSSFASDAEYDRRCHCDSDVKISYTPPLFDNNEKCRDIVELINEQINNSNRKYIYCKVKSISEDDKDNYRLIGDFDKSLDIKFTKNTKNYENSCE